ncbi:hypothetical protein AB1K18_28215 [Peribacillus simplex]
MTMDDNGVVFLRVHNHSVFQPHCLLAKGVMDEGQMTLFPKYWLGNMNGS